MSEDTVATVSDEVSTRSMKELCDAYDQANVVLEAAQASVENALRLRSDTVKAIALKAAPLKKISRGGREMTIVVRGDLYFLRGAKNTETVSAD